jgi:hypothetical protein
LHLGNGIAAFERGLTMKTTRRFPLILAVPLALALLVVGCNFQQVAGGPPVSASASDTPGQGPVSVTNTAAASEASATAAPTATSLPPTPTATPALTYPVGPDQYPAGVDPLTGLIVADPSLLNLRPLGIKVSNFPRSARPQAGLSQADLLFEMYTEGGSTRFLAMYYGRSADKVGPMRSARVEDTRIIPLYDAILVHVQAYQDVWDQMYASGIDFINEFPAACPAICRDPTVTDKVNSAFSNTQALDAYAKNVRLETGKPNLAGMVFDPAPPAKATPAQGLLVIFSQSARAEWRFDAGSGMYLRYSENDAGAMIPLDDRTTNKQIAVANAVVLFVPFNRYVGKTTTAEMWDLGLGGSGKAVFFRDGDVVSGTWKRVNPARPLQFFGSDGQPYALRPGNSWVALIGKSSSAIPSAKEWTFHMYFP